MSADDGKHGRELWSYSIKSGDYMLVRDIRSGSRLGSNPSELTSLNGQIVFAAEGNTYGRELWSSDGTKHGTNLLIDINPGGLDSNPKGLSLLNGSLYFTGNTYFNGRQILKLDGDGLKVTEVQGSLEETKASEPSDLHASRDQLFFSAETTIDSSEEKDDTTSSIGGSTDSDPGGFMAAESGIEDKQPVSTTTTTTLIVTDNSIRAVSLISQSPGLNHLRLQAWWKRMTVHSPLIGINIFNQNPVLHRFKSPTDCLRMPHHALQAAAPVEAISRPLKLTRKTASAGSCGSRAEKSKATNS